MLIAAAIASGRIAAGGGAGFAGSALAAFAVCPAAGASVTMSPFANQSVGVTHRFTGWKIRVCGGVDGPAGRRSAVRGCIVPRPAFGPG
jgi:hypothetical protein